MSPTVFDAVANFAVATVITPPSPATSGTSLTLASGQGARFPAAPFDATLWPGGSVEPLSANAEIVRVTAIVTDTLTITRAQESSSAQMVSAGWQIMEAVTAKTITDLQNAINAINGASYSAVQVNNGASLAAQTTLDVIGGTGVTVAGADDPGNSRTKVTLSATMPTLADTATVYVAADGNDANDGASWLSAVATIAHAISLLPLAADASTRNGTVEVGYGAITLPSSSARTDTNCATTNNSTTVTDPAIGSGDVGSYVIGGPHLDAQAKILTVIPGVSFTVSQPATGNASAQSMTIVKPSLDMGLNPGVRIRGRGRWNSTQGNVSSNYPTSLVDAGTGITVMMATGSGPGSLSGAYTMYGGELIDLTIVGNSTSMHGVYLANNAHWVIRGVTAANCGQFGFYIDANGTVHGAFEHNVAYNCGNAAATVATGGAYFGASPNCMPVLNFRAINCIGIGAWAGAGTSFYGCGFSHVTATAYAPASFFSPMCVYLTGAQGAGNVVFVDCWFEAQVTTGAGSQDCVVGLNNSFNVHFIGCNMKSNSSACAYAARYGGSGSVRWDACSWAGTFTTGIHIRNSSNTQPILWSACDTGGSLPSNGFIRDASGSVNEVTQVASVAASGASKTAHVTVPPAASNVTLTSGTAWQNTVGYDVELVFAITFAAGSDTAAFGRDATNGTTALPGTNQAAAGDVRTYAFKVPAGWFFKPTLTGTAALTGQAIAQPV